MRYLTEAACRDWLTIETGPATHGTGPSCRWHTRFRGNVGAVSCLLRARAGGAEHETLLRHRAGEVWAAQLAQPAMDRSWRRRCALLRDGPCARRYCAWKGYCSRVVRPLQLRRHLRVRSSRVAQPRTSRIGC